eukprot:2079915-Pyramimonas_sp.AAC.1
MQRLWTGVALRVLLFVRSMNVCRGCSGALSALTGPGDRSREKGCMQDIAARPRALGMEEARGAVA